MKKTITFLSIISFNVHEDIDLLSYKVSQDFKFFMKIPTNHIFRRLHTSFVTYTSKNSVKIMM